MALASKQVPIQKRTRIVLRVSALLGCSHLPFTDGKLKFSKALRVYSFAVLCLVTFCGFQANCVIGRFYSSTSLRVMTVTISVLNAAMHCASFFGARSEEMIERLRVIDFFLCRIMTFNMNSQCWWASERVSLFLLSVFFVLSAIGSFILPSFTYPFLYNFLAALTIGMISGQIVAMGFEVECRLRFMSSAIRKLKLTPQVRSDFVEPLSNVYNQLCDIIDLFSSYTGPHLLFITTISFLFVTFRIYVIYYFRDYTTLAFYLRKIWALYYCLRFSRGDAGCENIINKVTRYKYSI